MEIDLCSVESVLSLTYSRHATKVVFAGVVWEGATTKGVFTRLHFIIRLSAYDLTLCWLYTPHRDTNVCLATAHQADAALARGEYWGPLHGVPSSLFQEYTTWKILGIVVLSKDVLPVER